MEFTTIQKRQRRSYELYTESNKGWSSDTEGADSLEKTFLQQNTHDKLAKWRRKSVPAGELW